MSDLVECHDDRCWCPACRVTLKPIRYGCYCCTTAPEVLRGEALYGGRAVREPVLGCPECRREFIPPELPREHYRAVGLPPEAAAELPAALALLAGTNGRPAPGAAGDVWRALGLVLGFGDAAALPVVRARLGREASPLLRRELVRALWVLGGETSLAELARLLADPQGLVRREAALGLRWLARHGSAAAEAHRPAAEALERELFARAAAFQADADINAAD